MGSIQVKMLQQAWEGYRESVVLPGTSPTQVEQIRVAYYAAAMLILRLFDQPITQAAGVKMFESLKAEIVEFQADLEKRCT